MQTRFRLLGAFSLACLGIAQASLDETMRYVRERTTFGRGSSR